ncbi:hypothetical protein F4810DRAFT_711279 [Camillea tinctor]|nr:hypothetical protein F4810DRAFT_711279 [Camillea tinctor]
MADPAVALNGLAAILHLSSILVKLTKELRICAEAVHSAPKEIMIFIRETTNFTSLLNYFYDVARDATENVEPGVRTRRARLVRRISQQCDYVSRGIEELVRRFAELSSSGGSSSFQTLWARIMWLLKKPDVEGLRLTLQSAMAAVSLLTSLLMWEELRRKDGDAERTEMLREQIENGLPMARLARRALAEHQQRHGRVVESVPTASYEGMKEGTFDIEKIVTSSLRSYDRPEGHLESYPGRGRRLSRLQPEPTVVEPALPPSKPSRATSTAGGQGQLNRHSMFTNEGPSRGTRSMPATHQNPHHRISAPPPRRRRAPRHATDTRSEGRRDSMPALRKQNRLSEASRPSENNILELEEEALGVHTETTTEQGSDLIGIAEAVRIKRVRTDEAPELKREVVEIPKKRATEGFGAERAGTWPQSRTETAEPKGRGSGQGKGEEENESEDEARGRPRWRRGSPRNQERNEVVEEETSREQTESIKGEVASRIIEEDLGTQGKPQERPQERSEGSQCKGKGSALEAAKEGEGEGEGHEEVSREAPETPIERWGRGKQVRVVEDRGTEKRTWLDILIKKDSGEAGPSREQYWKPSTQIDDSGSSWTSYKGGGSRKSNDSHGSKKSHEKSRESSQSGSLSPFKLKTSSGRKRLQRRQLPSSI